MNPSLFGYIWRNSARAQIGLIGLSVVGLPFYYLSLELPKLIINRALGEARPTETFVGRSLANLDAEPLLMVLSFGFLAAVALHGASKFVLNVHKSRVSERLLRDMRRELCARALRFPLDQGTNPSTDEMVTMVVAELDSVGGFASDALALPAMQGGIFATGLLFIFSQDLLMGLAAVSLFPLQGVVTPVLQRQVNQLTQQRVRAVRRFAARFARSVDGIEQVRSTGAGATTLERIDQRLEEIQTLRYALVVRKSFIKLFNNSLFQLTPFLFLLFGGILVLRGELTLGALVAVLAAYKDLPPPARELIDYFQIQQDSQLKYQQVVAQFNPPGLESEGVLFAGRSATAGAGGVSLSVRGLELSTPGGESVVDGLSFDLSPGERVALLGLDADAGHAVARAVTRLRHAGAGEIRLGPDPLNTVPEATLRATVQLVTPRPVFLEDSLAADLWDERYGPPDLHAVMGALNSLGLRRDLLRIGLDAHLGAEHGHALVGARHGLALELQRSDPSLIEPFTPDQVNRYASLGTNIVWAVASAAPPGLERFYSDRYMLRTVDDAGLTTTLCALGEEIVADALRLEAERDASRSGPGSVLHADELASVRDQLGTLRSPGNGTFKGTTKRLLISFALRCSPDQLSLNDETEARILQARERFSRHLPQRIRVQIVPLEMDRYYPDLTVEENLVFGRLRSSEPRARSRLNALLTAALEECALDGAVRSAALQVNLATTASHRNADMEQRLGLARTLLGSHRLIVVDRATSELDLEDARSLIRTCTGRDRETTWLWILGRSELCSEFDRVIEVHTGADSR